MDETFSCNRFCKDVVREWKNYKRNEEEDVRVNFVINKKIYKKLIYIAKQHGRSTGKEIAKTLQLYTHACEELNI